MSYEASLKAKWDTQNAFDYGMKEAARKAAEEATAKEKAKADKEKYEMQLASARSLKQSGVANHVIAESLKLPLEVVEKL